MRRLAQRLYERALERPLSKLRRSRLPRDMSSEVPFGFLEENGLPAPENPSQPCKLPPVASFTAPREQQPHAVLMAAQALAVPHSFSVPSQRAGAARPRQSHVHPTGVPPDSSVKRVRTARWTRTLPPRTVPPSFQKTPLTEEAAKKVQALFRGQQCRAKVDIPTVCRRLEQLQADRHGFAGLGLALVVAVAMVAVIFLQSDVGGAHAVELALQRAVRPTPTFIPRPQPNSLPKTLTLDIGGARSHSASGRADGARGASVGDFGLWTAVPLRRGPDPKRSGGA